MVVDAPVVASEGRVAVPDGGVLEVSRAPGQRLAVRALIDLHGEANGRDLQRPQISAGVVEVARHLGVACGGNRGRGGRYGRIVRDRAAGNEDRGGCAVDRRAGGGPGIRRQIGGEGCPGVQGVGAGGAETGRNESGILTDVLILPGPAVRGGHRLEGCGNAIIRVAGSIDGIGQRPGCAGRNGQGGSQAHQAEKRA